MVYECWWVGERSRGDGLRGGLGGVDIFDLVREQAENTAKLLGTQIQVGGGPTKCADTSDVLEHDDVTSQMWSRERLRSTQWHDNCQVAERRGRRSSWRRWGVSRDWWKTPTQGAERLTTRLRRMDRVHAGGYGQNSLMSRAVLGLA